MTIKSSDIPKEVVSACIGALYRDMRMEDALAYALNAWNGMAVIEYTEWKEIRLPMTVKENTNVKA